MRTGHGTTPAAAVRTHTGTVREHNEDTAHVGERLWLVADGLGGHEGGEVASALAVEVIADRAGADGGAEGLVEAMSAAHEAIVGAGARAGTPDMGTTVVAALHDGRSSVHIAWVGDSRAYLLTEERLRQLTRDHNEAGELLAQGLITEEQAEAHPGQYILTRSLGSGWLRAPEPETVTVPAEGRLLLCSDGLNGELDQARIRDLLGTGTVEAAADALLEAALDGGADDNVTLVVVDLDGS